MQIEKSMKSLVFYSVYWLVRSVVKSYILHPKYGFVLITSLTVQRFSCKMCRVGDGPCRDSLTVRLAIAPGLGTNSLKFLKPAPILLKGSATPKSSQTQGPIYLKKSSQNRYIGSWVWQKIKIHILVPRFGQFKVARP